MNSDPQEEPLAQWLNSAFAKTDDLMEQLNRPAYRFLSKKDLLEGLGMGAEDLRAMNHIAARLQLIASNIEAHDKSTLKVVSNG